VEDLFRDLLETLEGYAFALLASEGMVGVFDEEVRAATDGLGLDVELEVDGGAEDGDFGVEIGGEGWLVFAARSVPELVGAQEVFGADLGPDTPDEGLFEPVDGNGDAAADIEVAVVDDALVGCDDDAGVDLFFWDGEGGGGNLDAVGGGDGVALVADAAEEVFGCFRGHGKIVSWWVVSAENTHQKSRYDAGGIFDSRIRILSA
jgi:hypothetical protein